MGRKCMGHIWGVSSKQSIGMQAAAPIHIPVAFSQSTSLRYCRWKQQPGLTCEQPPHLLLPAVPQSESHLARRRRDEKTAPNRTVVVLVATLKTSASCLSPHKNNNLRRRQERKIWYGSSLSRGDSRSTLFSPSSSSVICSSIWLNFWAYSYVSQMLE